MSHISSHIIIKGNYSENTLPPPGAASLEITYTPSAGLSEDQVNKNIAKLRRLADKIYHVESQPEE